MIGVVRSGTVVERIGGGGGFVRRVETGGKQETDFRGRWEMEGGPKDRWEAAAWATR